HDDEVEREVRADRQRHRQPDGGDDQDRQPAPHQPRVPNRPVGRNIRTRMKVRKTPIWPRLSPRNRPPRLSNTPMTRPPIRAPTKLPMPPRTTTVKAIRTKV